MNWTTEMVHNVSTKLKSAFDDFWHPHSDNGVNLREQIELAKKDWVYAHNYFQNVTDPDLIDHAIYMLEAAEAKYSYLLKQARELSRIQLHV